MENTSPINSTLVDLVQWLIALAIIFGFGFPYLCEGQKHGQPAAESLVFSEEMSNFESHQDALLALSQPLHVPDYGAMPPDQRIMTDLTQTIEQVQVSHNLVLRKSSGEKQRDTKTETDSRSDWVALIISSPPKSDFYLKRASDSPAAGNASASRPIEHSDVKSDKNPTPLSGKITECLFDSIIHEAASRYEVDPDLVKAIIMAESSYNPKAVSKKGAKGLMQLMPKTAKALGVKDSFNPEHNINAGVKYFRQLLNQFNGDVKLALAAYNAGSKKVKKYKGIPPFKTTRYYVKKVIEYHKFYQK
jgi:hypothetical protein